MSTRSAIGLQTKDGKIRGIYCHNDGYLEYNGKILKNNYTIIEKVEELLALGDISSLGKRVKPNKREQHTFNNPLEDVTVAYHRDRGDDLEPAREFDTVQDYVKFFKGCWCEYFYLFKDNKWYYSCGSSRLKLV